MSARMATAGASETGPPGCGCATRSGTRPCRGASSAMKAGALVIDETGFLKQGEALAGWRGNIRARRGRSPIARSAYSRPMCRVTAMRLLPNGIAPRSRGSRVLWSRLARDCSGQPEAKRDEAVGARRALLALADRNVGAARIAHIELARPADLLLRVLDHLAPLADPTDSARDREQHGEHRDRESHRLQRDA